MKGINTKEDFIRDLGIFELRGLARKLGVRSPTTKKREQLIEYILDASNRDDVVEEKTKKGRPYKELSSIDEILNTMTNGFSSSQSLDFCDYMLLAQEQRKFGDGEGGYSNETERVGYVRKNKETLCFIDISSDNWVFIPTTVQNADKLCQGDKVRVVAREKIGANQFIATKVVQINDADATLFARERLAYESEIISTETYMFGSKKIKKGRRNSFCLNEDLYENDDVLNLQKECKEKETIFVVLGVNTSFENQIYFSNLSNIENFTTKYGTSEDVNFNKIIDAINFVSQSTRSGKSVLLVINDVMEIERTILNYAKTKANGDEGILRVVMTELLSQAKAFKNGVSTSIVLGYREIDKSSQYLQNEILRICKEIE